jgi:hypothetical protein
MKSPFASGPLLLILKPHVIPFNRVFRSSPRYAVIARRIPQQSRSHKKSGSNVIHVRNSHKKPDVQISSFMHFQASPVVTRPNRAIHITYSGNHSPDAQSPHRAGNLSPGSLMPTLPHSPSGTATPPRAPIIHLFVCDSGNVKVKGQTDNFTEMLVKN